LFTTETLYTTVHLLLAEFKISLKSSLSTQSLCQTIRPRIRIWSPWSPTKEQQLRIPGA